MRIGLYVTGLILLFAILSAGCNRDNKAFEMDFDKVMKEKRGRELLNALLELDQHYANQIKLKINIGAMLLAGGNMDKAEIYLKSGYNLLKKTKDKGLKYLLFTNLAELSYRRSNYADGVRYARSALDLGVEDKIGVIFTKAKSLLAMKEQKEAYDDFLMGWENSKSLMSREDMMLWAKLLLDMNKREEALQVFDEYQLTFGYEIGIGLGESAIYEKMGQIEKSIIAAFKDLEYLRFTGSISAEKEMERLSNLETELSKFSMGDATRGRKLIHVLNSYLKANWEVPIDYFSSRPDGSPFERYILLVSQLEAGYGEAIATLKYYTNLEKRFKNFQGFYYHLWRGMKKGGGNYNIAVTRDILEKCILLSPSTIYARETRGELGRLSGLKVKEGEKILLGAELDSIYNRLIAGGDVALLEPVMELLSVPDNVYEMAALLMVKRAKQIPLVEVYLEDRLKKETARLKERLTAILGGM